MTETMALEAELQVESNLDQLPEVVRWFEQFKISDFPNLRWQQANLALIEGFTNAVRHAHGTEPSSQPLSLKAALSANLFWFEIWDQGAPYDFERAMAELHQVVHAPKFDPLQREKHWGGVIFLRLIQQFNWVIQYTRHENSKNCLRAQVNLSGTKQAQ